MTRLSIPEWVQPKPEQRSFWDRHDIVLLVIGIAIAAAFIIGLNKVYALGVDDGEKRGTRMTCAELPNSQHYSARCR